MMSVMSHKEARTSEVYTKGVERRGLAADVLKSLAALDWYVPRSIFLRGTLLNKI